MILTLDEVKNHLRIDLNEDDGLIKNLIIAAQQYLENATGKEYPETDSEGKEIDYSLEKVYLNLLIAYWYENRGATSSNKVSAAGGSVPDEFTYSTRSLLLQLKLK